MTLSPAVFNSSENSVVGKRLRRFLSYVKTPVIAASAIALLDPLVLEPISGSVSKLTLVLVLFLEGAIGLITSSAIALSSTPSISKVGEITFGTARWSREGEKYAEKVAGKWVIASALLILIGFVLSAF
jgi:hypothetical protein